MASTTISLRDRILANWRDWRRGHQLDDFLDYRYGFEERFNDWLHPLSPDEVQEWLREATNEIQALREENPNLTKHRQPLHPSPLEAEYQLLKIALPLLRLNVARREKSSQTAKTENTVETAQSPSADVAGNGGLGNPTVGANTIERRRKIVRQYNKKKGLKMVGLSHEVAISVRGIQAIIRGDRSRYSQENCDSFLKKIGVRRGQWDKE